MKPSLLFAMLSVAFASPAAFAKSELEILRSRCTEQERQIHQLERENTKLRSGERETRATPAKTETVANTIAKTEVATAAPTSPSTGPSYTVKAGDNFDKIARKIGTSPQKLAKANGLTPESIIRPGQKLKVPGKMPHPADRAVAAVSSSSPAPQNGKRTHTVKQGETFSSISKKHGIKVDTLVAANPKAKPSALRPGQVVNLGSQATSTISVAPAEKKSVPETTPTPKSPAVAQDTPVSKPAPAATAAAPPIPETKSTPPASTPTAASDKKIHAVTIDGEMTYGEFATKHGTDAERLNALNGLDLTTATVLAKGSELYVPAKP